MSSDLEPVKREGTLRERGETNKGDSTTQSQRIFFFMLFSVIIMNLNAFYLLLFFVYSKGVKSSLVKSDIKPSQEDLFEDSEILNILKEHGDIVHHDSHNEIKPKKDYLDGIEPPFEKVTISELCGSEPCGEVDSTSMYPQTEITTENEETTQTIPTTITNERSTDNPIAFTQDLTIILDETTSNSPPSEITTE